MLGKLYDMSCYYYLLIKMQTESERERERERERLPGGGMYLFSGRKSFNNENLMTIKQMMINGSFRYYRQGRFVLGCLVTDGNK